MNIRVFDQLYTGSKHSAHTESFGLKPSSNKAIKHPYARLHEGSGL